MNISLKKRTLLVLLSGLTATFTLAQQQPVARMAKPVCGGTEQTRSSHIRMALRQRF